MSTFEKNVDIYTYNELTHFDAQIIFDLASGRHPLAFKNSNIFQNAAKNNFSDHNKKNTVMTIIDICSSKNPGNNPDAYRRTLHE